MATTKKLAAPVAENELKSVKPRAKPAAKAVAKLAAPVAVSAPVAKKIAPKATAPVVAKPAVQPVVAAAPAAKPAVKKKAKARGAAIEPAQRANYIEVAAFYIAERRGFMPGNPEQDYLEAAAEIDRLIAAGHFGS